MRQNSHKKYHKRGKIKKMREETNKYDKKEKERK